MENVGGGRTKRIDLKIRIERLARAQRRMQERLYDIGPERVPAHLKKMEALAVRLSALASEQIEGRGDRPVARIEGGHDHERKS